MRCVALAFLVLAQLVCTGTHATSLQPAGKIGVKHPSFVEIFPRVNGGPAALWMTQFAPFSTGLIHYIDDIFAYAQDNFTTAKVQTLSAGFKWPNRIRNVPAGALAYNKSFNGIVVPDGFLVPGSSNGGLYILPTDTLSAQAARVDSAPKGWFYHNAVWKDMNGDGRMDLITARATKPLIGSAKGQLLWLEQPSQGDPLTQKWTEHVLTAGPDILFTVIDLDNSTSTYSIFCPEFFGKQLGKAVVDRTGKLISYDIVDSDTGPGYDIDVADLDGDGHVDLLLTNHEGKSGGSVTARAGPDFTKKYTLSTGFQCVVSGFNCGAPGMTYAVHPSSSSDPRPSILVAGDGSGAGYLMVPTGPFTYNRTVVMNPGKTVGSIGVQYLSQETPTARATYAFFPVYEDSLVLPFQFV